MRLSSRKHGAVSCLVHPGASVVPGTRQGLLTCSTRSERVSGGSRRPCAFSNTSTEHLHSYEFAFSVKMRLSNFCDHWLFQWEMRSRETKICPVFNRYSMCLVQNLKFQRIESRVDLLSHPYPKHPPVCMVFCVFVHFSRDSLCISKAYVSFLIVAFLHTEQYAVFYLPHLTLEYSLEFIFVIYTVKLPFSFHWLNGIYMN